MVRLIRGEASVLGAPLLPQMSLIVRKEKQIPVESQTEAEVELSFGEAGGFFEIAGSSIPRSWGAAAEALIGMGEGRVAIVGMADVGKSSICTYLLNELLKAGRRASIIDGDVGQADLGPPTTIGRTTPSAMVPSLIELDPQSLIFIGDTTPSYVETKLINGIKRLANLDNIGLTLINTDGWVVEPEAVHYKIQMLRAIETDLVLAMALNSELQPILASSHTESLQVEPAHSILERSRADRRAIRNYGYHRYLAGGKMENLKRQDFKVSMPDDIWQLWRKDPESCRNLILGLLDSSGFLQQIGVLVGAEAENLRIFSRPAANVQEVEFGYIKLSTEGTELGHLN